MNSCEVRGIAAEIDRAAGIEYTERGKIPPHLVVGSPRWISYLSNGAV
jgi:hypothetical protein